MKKKMAIALCIALTLQCSGCGLLSRAAREAASRKLQGQLAELNSAVEEQLEQEAEQMESMFSAEDNTSSQDEGTEEAENVEAENVDVENAEVENAEVHNLRLYDISHETEIYTSDSYDTVGEFEYHTIGLFDEEKEAWPALSQALTKWNKEYQESQKKACENLKKLVEEDLSQGEDNQVTTMGAFEELEPLDVIRADTKVLSFVQNSYSYLGGAHPYYFYNAQNFDTATGELLTLQDVVLDVDKLQEILTQKLMDKYAEDVELDKSDVVSYLSENLTRDETVQWVLGYEELTVIVNVGGLGAYVSGNQTVSVRFDEAPEIFRKEYTLVPKVYVLNQVAGEDVITDVDMDGTLDDVLLFDYNIEYYYDLQNDDYGLYREIYINQEKKYSDRQEWAYDNQFYLVHTPTGCYAYSLWCGEGGYLSMDTFDLSAAEDGVQSNIAAQFMSVGYGYSYEEGELVTAYHSADGRAVFSNPENPTFSSYTDALSTTSGVRDFYLDENGYYQAESDLLDVSRRYYVDEFSDYESEATAMLEFTTKMELTLDEVGENGEILNRDVTIAAGTKLYYYRTDEKAIADFITSDGKIYRGDICVDDWPQTIEGIELEEALDGVMFAG